MQETEPRQPGAATLLIILLALTIVILLLVGYIFPAWASGVRATVREENLATARALAATARAATPTPTLNPTETAISVPLRLNVRSGGLGLFPEQWRRLNDIGGAEVGSFTIYAAGVYIIELRGGRLWYLERNWDADDAPSLTEARRIAYALLPFDSAAQPPAERPSRTELIERYTSDQLRGALLADNWGSMIEGRLTVRYIQDAETANVLRIALVIDEPGEAEN